MYTDPKKMAARFSSNMTLDMPTPEVLEADALDLERRAGIKERHAVSPIYTPASREYAARDAAAFREEATAKRAKAERMRKAAQ